MPKAYTVSVKLRQISKAWIIEGSPYKVNAKHFMVT